MKASEDLVQPPLPLICCVAQGELVDLSEPLFPHLEMGVTLPSSWDETESTVSEAPCTQDTPSEGSL